MSKVLKVTETLIENKIYLIIGQKVMVDFDLAEMYAVETKRLKEQVKRNIDRFPEDFMFEMNEEEFGNWRSQNVTSNSLKMGLRYKPFCFSEHGVLMLPSVLRSEQAVQVNIQIMRVYSKMKELLMMHKDILVKLEQLENKTDKHDDQIQLIFSYIKKLIEQAKERSERIGFKKEW